MGCCFNCCKRKKLEQKPIPENQDPTEDEEDLKEKLIESNRETEINNAKSIQELPSTENATEKNPDTEKKYSRNKRANAL